MSDNREKWRILGLTHTGEVYENEYAGPRVRLQRLYDLATALRALPVSEAVLEDCRRVRAIQAQVVEEDAWFVEEGGIDPDQRNIDDAVMDEVDQLLIRLTEAKNRN